MIMQHHDLSLKDLDPACKNEASHFEDQTLGQYLAGFWEYHIGSEGSNFMEIHATEGRDPGCKEKYWKIYFMIGGMVEGDPWNWGFSFIVLDRDWVVQENSFRCWNGGVETNQ